MTAFHAEVLMGLQGANAGMSCTQQSKLLAQRSEGAGSPATVRGTEGASSPALARDRGMLLRDVVPRRGRTGPRECQA